MKETWLSTHEAATLLGVSGRWIRNLIQKGRISKFREVTGCRGRSGKNFEVALSILNPDAQALYFTKKNGGTPLKQPDEVRKMAMIKYSEANEQQRKLAQARKEVLDLASKYLENNPKVQKTQALKRFLSLYNAGFISKNVEITGKIALQTLYKMQKKHRKYGISGLLPGKNGRNASISEKIRQMAVFLIWEKSRSIKKVYKYLLAEFKKETPSYTTILRFCSRYIYENQEALCLHHKGEKTWRSKYGLAIGTAAADCQQPNDKWEIDSTPADIITKEGCRAKIVALIDVYSRRPIVRLWEKNNAWGVAQTIRSGILLFGMPKKIIKDNGLDYQSKLVNNFLSDLGIKYPKLPPYHPEKKPHIERFFGTLSGDLFSELTGYTGNCLKNRPEVVVSVYTKDELQELINNWVAYDYEEERHAFGRPRELWQIKGFSPQKVSDERLLDILLMPLETRTVVKGAVHCKVKINTGHYYSPDLPQSGTKVSIRVDLSDASRIFVFSLDGKFICMAEDPAGKGMTPKDIQLAHKMKKDALKQQINAMEKLQKIEGQDRRFHDYLKEKEAAKPLIFPQKEDEIKPDARRQQIEKILPYVNQIPEEELPRSEDQTAEEIGRAYDSLSLPMQKNVPPEENNQAARPCAFSDLDIYYWLLKRKLMALPMASEDLFLLKEIEGKQEFGQYMSKRAQYIKDCWQDIKGYIFFSLENTYIEEWRKENEARNG